MSLPMSKQVKSFYVLQMCSFIGYVYKMTNYDMSAFYWQVVIAGSQCADNSKLSELSVHTSSTGKS